MESKEQLFALILELCKEELSEVPFKLWLSDLNLLEFGNSTIHLETSNEFKYQIIKEKYLPSIQEKFDQTLGFSVPVTLSYNDREAYHAAPFGNSPEAAQRSNDFMKPFQSVLNPDNGNYEYTFDTFIVGTSNKFAHAAAQAVAANPAKAYNPLFIYGNSGLGKTHLLHAIQTDIRHSYPHCNIIYIKGDEFANQMIEAIKTKTNNLFREKYRKADVLLVDDIQFIGGKDSTQEEFFHTFNTLYEDQKQIVLASDRPPKEIKTLEDRLRTRFESGLIADIQIPEFETRIAIIKRKAQLINFQIPDDVAEYIAERLKTNIRQLEGVVKKMKFQQELQSLSPTLLSAQSAIKDILNDNEPVPITVDRVINEVARSFNVLVEDITSNKRSAQISNARQACMYIVREVTGLSTTGIGDKFGGRDHSTVVYAIKQAEKTMSKDSHYRAMVDDIIKNIRSK